MITAPRASVLALAVLVSACTDPDRNVIRGRGHTIAALKPEVQAEVYRAALRAAFDVTDPNLVLLLHPRMLPRLLDRPDGDSVPPELNAALRKANVVQGSCTPREVEGRKTPRCPDADTPGYVVRFSDIFTLPADTLLLYASAQQYDIPSAPSTDVVHFENAYKVVKSGDMYRAVKEARVPK